MPVEIIALDQMPGYLRTSLDELAVHARSGPVPADVPRVVVRSSFQSAAKFKPGDASGSVGGRAQFDLWWMNVPSQVRPALLWDRWELRGLTRAQYAQAWGLFEASGFPFEKVVDDPQWLGDLPPLRPQALSKYHPERFRAVMPFAARIAEIGRQYKGGPTVDTLNALMAAWQAVDGAQLASRPLRQRLRSTTRGSRHLFDLGDMLLLHAVYCANGRQIFDMPPALTEMFRRTDVDDIAAEHIKVPYPGLYLHFGPQPDLAMDPAWTPEGAYVQEIGTAGSDARVLQLCVVSAPSDLEAYREFDVNIEPVYTQALGPEHMKMPLGEAVEVVLSNLIATLSREIEGEPMQEHAAEQGAVLVSVQSAKAAKQLDVLAQRHRVYLEMLKLIVNSLAYLTAYPKDIQTTWPAKTPPSLLRELDKTDNRNERRRLLSKLAQMGFTPVHLCGRKLVAELAARSGGSGRHPAAHWRRGHWRRQPHGPQNTLRKLVWLMPTLVNAAAAGQEPMPGHLYLVS